MNRLGRRVSGFLCCSFNQVAWSRGVAKKEFMLHTFVQGIGVLSLSVQARCVPIGGLNLRCVKCHVIFLMVMASRMTGSLSMRHPVFFGKVVPDGL